MRCIGLTYYTFLCRAQEVLSTLGIKSNWRFGEATGSKQKAQRPAPAEAASDLQNGQEHEDPQPEAASEEPDPKRPRTDSSAPADISTVAADVSNGDICAAVPGSQAETGPQMRVFDVAWQGRNEVRFHFHARSLWAMCTRP
jgi:hypothetical protein